MDPLAQLAEAAAGCRACDLWRGATQTVFGVGAVDATMFLVGEQPGDREDRAGVPFVGPAGRVLDDAIEDAGLPREELYVTNVVKHFKWKPRGKRRIHDTPNRSEVVACNRWLRAEIDVVDPPVIVALGRIAGQALLGPSFKLGDARGQLLDFEGRAVVATNHPSAILRITPGPERDAAYAGLVADLRRAAELRP